MMTDERMVMVYASLEDGKPVTMPVAEWARYLREFADEIENAPANTFIADLQPDGSFKLTGVMQTISEMLAQRDTQQ